MHSCTQSSNIFPNICAPNASMTLYLLIITKGKYNFLDLKTNAKKKNIKQIKPLSATPTKWSNTLKQFVVLHHFVGLALKGLNNQGFTKKFNSFEFTREWLDDIGTILKNINTGCIMEQCWLIFDISKTFILPFFPHWKGYALYQGTASLGIITLIIRTGYPILVEQIDLVNYVYSDGLKLFTFLGRFLTEILMMILRCNVLSIHCEVGEDEIRRTK